MTVRATTMTLGGTLLRRETLVCVAGVVGFAAVSAVAAQVRIPLPFSPVPITLQTLVVLLAGAALGARAGLASQALYLGLGALGLPIFAAAGAGLSGASAGYLLAFPLAAGIVGWAARKGSFRWTAAAMVAATLLIYGLGALWLALVTGQGIGVAVSLGVLPFIPGDILKLAGALCLAGPVRSAYTRATGE